MKIFACVLVYLTAVVLLGVEVGDMRVSAGLLTLTALVGSVVMFIYLIAS